LVPDEAWGRYNGKVKPLHQIINKSMTVKGTFQDYDDDDPDIKFRINRDKFWRQLKNLRTEYNEKFENFDNDTFMKWIEDTYGLRIIMNNSYITDKYDIVDEKKHLVFLLKFS